MKKIVFGFLFFVLLPVYSQNFNFERKWATYYSDENLSVSATVIDTEGNLYLAGRSLSLPFVTAFAYQPELRGDNDGFIVKINPAGETVWGTYFGGDGGTGILSMAIGQDNAIYVLGITTSTTGIADATAYQPQNAGGRDAFIAKFTPEGNKLWSTYYGGALDDVELGYPNGFESPEQGIAVGAAGDVYIYCHMDSPGMATAGAFQTASTQQNEYMITKFSADGVRAWSTYYGINSSKIRGIAVGETGVYVVGDTNDCGVGATANTYFGTAGTHQPAPGDNCRDGYLTKFTFDGQRAWSTYFGGESVEFVKGHAVKCFGSFIYLCGITNSRTGIATTGAFQEIRGMRQTSFLTKFNEQGTRLWGTYCGLDEVSNNNATSCNTQIDREGNVYLCGGTSLSNNIATPGAFKTQISGLADGFAVKFNPEGEKIWGTYYGGSRVDLSIQALVHEDGFYFVGLTKSPDNISTENGLQPTGIFDPVSLESAYIVRFDPLPLSLNDVSRNGFSIYPNPAKGYFQLQLKGNKDCNIIVYNALGQEVLKRSVVDGEVVDVSGMMHGVYFVKVEHYGVVKLVVQ